MSDSRVLRRSLILLAAIFAGVPAAEPALAQPACTLTQITQSAAGSLIHDVSLDGSSIAFASTADLTGENRDHSAEVFLFDGAAMTQVTDSVNRLNEDVSLDGESIAFTSNANLTGENPDGNREIFLFDGATLTQITHATSGDSYTPSLDGGSIAFASTANLTGKNPDGNTEILLFDGSTITQITDFNNGNSFDSFSAFPSLDGGSIAFYSNNDLTGGNPDSTIEIFLFDGTTITQITDSTSGGGSAFPSLHGGSIAFRSRADLVGNNPDASDEIFLFDGSAIRQITHSNDGLSGFPDLNAGSIAFVSTADLTGGNADHNSEIFLFDGSAITQVTSSANGDSGSPSLDGGSIAFGSSANLTGGNPDLGGEIFLASCDAQSPVPPPGPYLTSGELPGFRFKVRITSGAQVITGQKEAGCIGETLCVSGALQGRSELFLRIIGPRPNGFLWLNLVRFTPSRVEVWAEQTATGKLNYYDLPALPPADTELAGKVDKEAFLP